MNQKIGWGFGIINNSNICSNIHTINGGDTTFLVGLHQVSSQVPKDFMLFQNYPNPFNPKTNIKYRITNNNSFVNLEVYDITGRETEVLVNEEQNAGTFLIDWNASAYSSGIYFYRLTVNSGKEVFTETKKFILLK